MRTRCSSMRTDAHSCFQAAALPEEPTPAAASRAARRARAAGRNVDSKACDSGPCPLRRRASQGTTAGCRQICRTDLRISATKSSKPTLGLSQRAPRGSSALVSQIVAQAGNADAKPLFVGDFELWL